MTELEKEQNNSDYQSLLKQVRYSDIDVYNRLNEPFIAIENDMRVLYFNKYKALYTIEQYLYLYTRIKYYSILYNCYQTQAGRDGFMKDFNKGFEDLRKNLQNYWDQDEKKAGKAMLEMEQKKMIPTILNKRFLSKGDVDLYRQCLNAIEKKSFRFLETTKLEPIVYDCITLVSEQNSEMKITTRMEILFDIFVPIEKHLTIKKFETKKDIFEKRGKDKKNWTTYKKDAVKSLIGL